MAIISKETIIGQLESSEEFPIALSEVWEWLGYSTKGNALKAFDRLELSEGKDFEVVIHKDKNLAGGRPTSEVKIAIDAFKGWAMSSQTAKGREVRRYYLQVEKEWKAQKSAIPEVTADQVEAFMFQKNVYLPWVDNHPIAAAVFMGWQGITTSAEPRSPNNSPSPSIESQKALDGAFLNLNRSGLMMNKLFHFLDRIPTMKALDEDFVNDLVSSLSESERVRAELNLACDALDADLKTAVKRSDVMERENKRLKAAVKGLTLDLERLERELEAKIPAKSPKNAESSQMVWTGKVPSDLKSAN